MSTNPPAVANANQASPGSAGQGPGDRSPSRSGANTPRKPSMFAIYKPGQGYYTRMFSAVGAATLVLTGVAWLWGELQRVESNTIYWQAGVAVAVIAVFGSLLFYIFNKPRVADFMIATEAEMKKVNWPSKREIVGATVVVIVGTLLLAALLFAIDVFFGWAFLEIGILESGGPTP